MSGERIPVTLDMTPTAREAVSVLAGELGMNHSDAILVAFGCFLSALDYEPNGLLAAVDRSGRLSAWVDEHRDDLVIERIFGGSSDFTVADILGDKPE